MKKYGIKHLKYLARRARGKKRRKKVPKGKNTKQYRAYKHLHDLYSDKLKTWDAQRRAFYPLYYRPIEYFNVPKRVIVDKQIGVESDIEFLSSIGGQLLGNPQSSDIIIDISNCPRVWPSGVMTLCSFRHWADLTAREGATPPRISSTDANEAEVSAYLDFCGFHKYVRRRKSGMGHKYPESGIVKIRREPGRDSVDERFDEISNLVRDNCAYDADEVEEFQANVLTEAFINVTEHGINVQDIGWYTLAQVHPTSGILSVNIADNGIGIKNSLKTGPQKVSLIPDSDHIYILEAFKENISGAFAASTEKKGIIRKKFEKGQRRGNGLRYIRESCANLGIKFSLISAKGLIQFDFDGLCIIQKTHPDPVFAGTLYNFSIPLKRVKL